MIQRSQLVVIAWVSLGEPKFFLLHWYFWLRRPFKRKFMRSFKRKFMERRNLRILFRNVAKGRTTRREKACLPYFNWIYFQEKTGAKFELLDSPRVVFMTGIRQICLKDNCHLLMTGMFSLPMKKKEPSAPPTKHEHWRQLLNFADCALHLIYLWRRETFSQKNSAKFLKRSTCE